MPAATASLLNPPEEIIYIIISETRDKLFTKTNVAQPPFEAKFLKAHKYPDGVGLRCKING